jgi:N-methylhydantoinase A
VLETRQVHFGEAGGWIEAKVYDRDKLLSGATFDGPAIVQELDSTTTVPPGASCKVDEYLNLAIDVRGIARA